VQHPAWQVTPRFLRGDVPQARRALLQPEVADEAERDQRNRKGGIFGSPEKAENHAVTRMVSWTNLKS
jgi:hypothetical protein